jgi:TolA-binding protein
VRISSFTICLGLITALALTGCADQSSGMNQLNQNEFALRGMIASDRQQIDSLKAELSRTQGELEELKHGGAVAAASAPPAPGDVNDRLAKLESEVNAIQTTLPMPPPSAGIGAMPPPSSVGSMPPPVGAPPSSAGLTGSSAGAPPPAASAGAEPAPTWPQDLDKALAASQTSNDPGAKIYRKGLEAMKAGNYSSAIVDFSKVQHSYAKSPLSEPAQYFTGNAFYESGKYEQAILQFNDMTMRFPNSTFTCQSLLREGQAFVRLNDRIDARLTLQKLAANGSCASESVAANNMLKSLSD